ncbi:MAG: hypothetical protein U0326_40580 [Polyangiales bacterium]
MRASMMGVSSRPLGAPSRASPQPPPPASPASPQPPLPRPAPPRGDDPVTLPVASMAKSAKPMQRGVSGLKARLRAPTMNLDVSATLLLATPAPEVQPIEASATIRAKPSLLDDSPPPPVDIFETLPPTRMQTIPPPSRKAAELPLGGPDANPVLPGACVSMASPPPEPKLRPSTVALDVGPFVESTTMKRDDAAVVRADERARRAARPCRERCHRRQSHAAGHRRAAAERDAVESADRSASARALGPACADVARDAHDAVDRRRRRGGGVRARRRGQLGVEVAGGAGASAFARMRRLRSSTRSAKPIAA